MKPDQSFSRRQVLTATACVGAGLVAGATGCSQMKRRSRVETRVAFVTANLVARVTDYRFELAHWGEQHKTTVAATDEIAATESVTNSASVISRVEKSCAYQSNVKPVQFPSVLLWLKEKTIRIRIGA